jgi:hypothetical protein
MNRHLIHGIIVGALFALPTTWIAASDAIAEGNLLTILSTALFGLAAGLCLGGLIAGNFAMLAVEEEEKTHAPARQHREAHANA